MATQSTPLSRAFVWRRLQSLFGLWIVIFLVEHLITNSQAALLIGANGEGFIRAVNFLKNLPYLPVIEIVLLGVPILMHMVWGIRILLTSKMNSFPSNGTRPALGNYRRNQAYSWQRITSYLLVIGLLAHIGYMRFYMYPKEVDLGKDSVYFVRINMDPGLNTVSERLGVTLYNQSAIDAVKEKKEGKKQKAFLKGLEARAIDKNQVIAEAPDFGTATLLAVRDSFKSPLKCILYTIFVLSAVFHAFNGLWTFMITWGIVIKMRSQSKALNWCYGIMVVIGFLGLAAVWGTYYVNLRN